MKSYAILLPALALAASAAPHFPKMNLHDQPRPGQTVEAVSNYFNLLAEKIAAAGVMGVSPTCDITKAHMPTTSEPLPPVSAGLSLKHVAIGRGTQNYTCDTTNATAVPAPVGALATLFKANCVAVLYPDLLERMVNAAVHFDVQETSRGPGPIGMDITGKHYFTNDTTAHFDLDVSATKIGQGSFMKNSSALAPSTAATGLNGEVAVPWLKLTSIPLEGATGKLQEVYRLNTVGGSAPASCDGQPEQFQVQYSAVYWFFAGDITPVEDDE